MNVSPPLRIVHCFRSPVGGIFRHVRDLAKAQQEAGHQVGIICDSTSGGPYEDQCLKELEPFLSLGITKTPMQRHIGLGDLLPTIKIYKLIKSLQPDVLHGHGAKGGVYARLLGSVLRVFRYRVARLYSPHGGSLHYDSHAISGRILFAVERLLDKGCDQVLFVSNHECQTFHDKIGAPSCPYDVIYNGLNDVEFEPIKLNENCADFMFMGMTRLLKGPDIFLDAFVLANEQYPELNLRAVLVGDGEDKPALVEKVHALNLGNKVQFFDPMPARDAFKLGRIMILSSRAEALPYTVLEAVGAGKILLATRVGGIPEILGEQSLALMEPTPQDVAKTMMDAHLNQHQFETAMPPNDYLRKNFSATVMAKKITQIYRDLLQN